MITRKWMMSQNEAVSHISCLVKVEVEAEVKVEVTHHKSKGHHQTEILNPIRNLQPMAIRKWRMFQEEEIMIHLEILVSIEVEAEVKVEVTHPQSNKDNSIPLHNAQS